jgi:pimeloyl-ACP methyl ester carboxylesterase
VDATGWRQLVALLAPEHRILTFDRRGHSRSAGAGGGTLDDDVDDLASLIESLDLAPAHVVGNAPHRTHPEQYAALLRDFTAQVG